jgi:hypothetical protein
VAESAPVDCVPLVALLPLQPPDAVQLVAFVLLQLNVELAPLAMEVGLTVSVTVGLVATALPVIVTVADEGDVTVAPVALLSVIVNDLLPLKGVALLTLTEIVLAALSPAAQLIEPLAAV